MYIVVLSLRSWRFFWALDENEGGRENEPRSRGFTSPFLSRLRRQNSHKPASYVDYVVLGKLFNCRILILMFPFTGKQQFIDFPDLVQATISDKMLEHGAQDRAILPLPACSVGLDISCRLCLPTLQGEGSGKGWRCFNYFWL